MAASRDTVSERGHVVEASGVSFYYESQGRGKPLVLLHGGSLTGDMWRPYLSAFAEHYQVITPDMSDHGRSSSPPRAMSYRQLAEEMVDFVKAMGLTKPQIVGFSDGGQVALEIGMRHPGLAQSIVLAGVIFRFSDSYLAFIRNAVGDEESREVDFAVMARNHPDWVAWLEQLYGPDRWRSLMARLKPMWTTPFNYTVKDFAAITAPTLVLIGDRDELVPVDEATEMYRLLGKAELAVVPGADHGDFFSRKVPIFQSVIMDFLGRHSD